MSEVKPYASEQVSLYGREIFYGVSGQRLDGAAKTCEYLCDQWNTGVKDAKIAVVDENDGEV